MAARDEAGFEEFVAARSGDLLRTAVLLTRDRGHAEDLLQTALVKAYRRWGRIELVDGAGTAPAPPQEPQFVRIIDDAGALLVAAAVTELAD